MYAGDFLEEDSLRGLGHAAAGKAGPPTSQSRERSPSASAGQTWLWPWLLPEDPGQDPWDEDAI